MFKQLLNDYRLWLVASLTLGLAPFFPEPHLLGKLKWLFGDPSSMKIMDWLDLGMHGLPWVLFIRALIVKMLTKKQSTPPQG